MTKSVKVLHFTTHNEDCGIGEYQRQFLEAMGNSEGVYNEIFPYSPNKTKVMSYTEFSKVLDEFSRTVESFDVLHVQHELSFYRHKELARLVDAAKAKNKKVIMSIHTAPDAQYRRPQRDGLGPRSIVKYLRSIKIAKEFDRVHLDPMRKADLLLVHNTMTKNSLIRHGITEGRVQVIQHPVPIADFSPATTEIRDALSYRKGDIIFASVGFVSRMKGVDHAIKALKFLPENYKLAIIGGVHPAGSDQSILDDLCDLIIKLDLRDRVYITGFVEDDQKLHALIRECAICVYPYDRAYYSYVTSGALFQAIANNKAVVAYPTKPFVEMNKNQTVAICKSGNYYELARYLKVLEIKDYERKAKAYATRHSYGVEAGNLVAIYSKVTKGW